VKAESPAAQRVSPGSVARFVRRPKGAVLPCPSTALRAVLHSLRSLRPLRGDRLALPRPALQRADDIPPSRRWGCQRGTLPPIHPAVLITRTRSRPPRNSFTCTPAPSRIGCERGCSPVISSPTGLHGTSTWTPLNSPVFSAQEKRGNRGDPHHDRFGEDVIASAILGRLLHHSEINVNYIIRNPADQNGV
jgi:hypothetical protein